MTFSVGGEKEMKLIVRPSNLLFRMYKVDGWDQELCDSFLIKGASHCYFPNDRSPYYVYDEGCKIDVPKFIKECVIQPCGFWSEREKARTAEEIINEYY